MEESLKLFFILSLLYIQPSVGTSSETDVCSLPPADPGDCDGVFPKWTFDGTACMMFDYGGCGGNDNRFETKEECEAACPSDVCSLPLVTGPCEALIQTWGFKDGVCKEFIYGGCQGNDNRFDTKEECETACSPADTCSLPLEEGPCKEKQRRWGFQDGSCKTFQYGGCGGNDNNFLSKKECEDLCAQ